ncbi:MAG: ATP-binding protein [Desulfobulbaceae bacterium]|nr:ATP-binding protein [Desulfobulbaceae bacterium]
MLGVRSKTIIAIVAVILTISASYFFFFVKQRDQNRELVIQCKKELVSELIASMTRELNEQYSSRIRSFAQRYENIIEHFAAGEREQLYAATLPIYRLLQNENPHFDHINFILPDNTVFLRMNEPEQYGDEERFTCSVYSDISSMPEQGINGFVYGDCGLLYRVVQPIFHRDQFIGSVLFGVRMDSFVDDIRDNLDMHTALALRRDLVDEGSRDDHGVVSGAYLIQYFDDPFFAEKAAGIDMTLTGEEQSFVHDGAVHFVFPSYFIRDREGREIGRILQGIDLTTIVKSYNEDITRLSLITVSVLVLASLILYLAFSKLLGEFVALNRKLEQKNRELVEAGQQLEEQVLKRTAELGEANARLIQEIEERQEANLSLVRSIEEWQSTFDAITDPVTILDTDLEVVIANRAAHDMLSRDDREIVGRTCYELFAGRSEPCKLCPASDVFATGVDNEYEVEHEFLGKSLLVSCSPILDRGEVTGYIYTAKDITQEKILKKQLSQAQKMEAIATLAGGIAHDFNNILGAILGNADLLLYRLSSPVAAEGQKIQALSPEDIATHIAAIKKAGNRAKELVSQILAFSRQSKTQRQNVLITPVIKEGVKLLRSSLAANIEIISSIEPEPCHINADLSQIHQVFMNLCTNAAQAMAAKGGVLEISLRNFKADSSTRKKYPDVGPGKYLVLTVKDTGHGMPPEILERIFDPFFTTRDVGEGTGMGLSVIHGIITSHDGVLDVKSEVDVGSEFTVFFPCTDDERGIADDPVLGVPRGREKILFVDDEFDIVKMTTSMLQYLGYTVLSATSGEKALEMLQGEAADVDLLICDYSMPGISGTDLAAEIINIRQDLPVILCSGFSESVVLDENTKRVIRKFMSKPLDMKKLAVVIREVLS